MVVSSAPVAAGGTPTGLAGDSLLESEGTAFGVSLVVPVRDEETSVGALVDSIAQQTLRPASVLFVDGGSSDGTAPLLRAACVRHEGWRLLEVGAATPGRGRNVGIAAAETEWVALTDAGVRLDSHWLERLVRVARADPTAEVVWGAYQPIAETSFERSAALAYVEAPRPGWAGAARGPSVASCLLHREVWSRAGGFPDLRAAEDLLFIRRLNDTGVRTAVAPEAMAQWHLAPTARATFRRFRTYSRVNAEIGEEAHWHRGVLRIHAASMPFLVAGVLGRRRWLLAPAVGSVARSVKSTWARRAGRSGAWALNPARVAGVAVVLAITDAATFAGWVDALLGRGGG